jgi:Uma2 family endonuclease
MSYPARKEIKKFSYAEYLKWDDDRRWELIDGIEYDMTPAPYRMHQEISGILFNTIFNFLSNKSCKVYSAPFDVRLPDTQNDSNENIYNVVQPDIVVVCDLSKLDERGCAGAPDLVIEILSPSTAVKDIREKYALYEKHQVKEYWVVHPEDKYIIIYNLENTGKFIQKNIYSGEDSIESSVLKELKMVAKDIFIN